MIVRDVMTSNPVTVQRTDSLRKAVDHMTQIGARRVIVVDDQGRVCGILTDRDVRLAVNSPLVLRERWQDDMLMDHTEVDACMTPDPICIKPDAPLEEAVKILLERKISGLPVVEDIQLVGIITVTDMLRALQTLLSTH
ncbi:MAG TPA: CBS domain-containing protein [Aggregatilineaceae bacterium]|nr:CBS domain-containing protein [Aggregatilineaceae bacterium]